MKYLVTGAILALDFALLMATFHGSPLVYPAVAVVWGAYIARRTRDPEAAMALGIGWPLSLLIPALKYWEDRK